MVLKNDNNSIYNAYIWIYKAENNEIKAEIRYAYDEYQENIIRNKPETIELILLTKDSYKNFIYEK